MNILILGANSDVAHATAKIFAKLEQASFYLASRDMSSLEKKAADLKSRYNVLATVVHFDALNYDSHRSFYDHLTPKPDGVILAFGHYANQEQEQKNFADARKTMEINYLGAASILEIIAADFEKRAHGFIVGISSVAGDRGRQTNYIYGSAKAAVSTYLSGLRNRLAKHNVHVLTVLPGFIRTKMTRGLALPGALVAEPDEVARDIYHAVKKKKNIIYTKWFWKYIMLIIRNIPESIFKRLSL